MAGAVSYGLCIPHTEWYKIVMFGGHGVVSKDMGYCDTFSYTVHALNAKNWIVKDVL